MSGNVPTAGKCDGLDLFVGAGPSQEACIAAIDSVLGLGTTQFVDGTDIDALNAAIDLATKGWVACHASDRPLYPHKFDVELIDGRRPIEAIPQIVRRLGVGVVVPDNGAEDPYAGLRFDPDGTVQSFSTLALGEE